MKKRVKVTLIIPTKNEISLEKVSGGQKQLALIHTNYYSIDVIPKLYSMA